MDRSYLSPLRPLAVSPFRRVAASPFRNFIGPISPICGDGLGGLEARTARPIRRALGLLRAGKNGPEQPSEKVGDIRNVKNV